MLVPRVRCLAEQYTLVAAGRWASNSHSFMIYFKEGVLMKRRHMPINGQVSHDPVWKFWVWEATTGDYTE